MRDKTRDKKRFPLVFKELCSYGFWRNLWGLRMQGLLVSILCFLVNSVAIYFNWQKNQAIESYNLIISEILSFALISFWVSLNGDKIKLSTFAYAERLFEAVDNVESK
jgi:hypothetical protein